MNDRTKEALEAAHERLQWHYENQHQKDITGVVQKLDASAARKCSAALSAQGEAKPEPRAAEPDLAQAVIGWWRARGNLLFADTPEFVKLALGANSTTLPAAVATPEPQEGRKPLSLVKINELRRAAVHGPADWVVHFARAVERAQGITQDGEPS